MTHTPASLPRRIRLFTRSLLSRYLGYSRRVDPEAKTFRKLSCNGQIGVLGPCEFREHSRHTEGAFYCGACGCGDRPAVFVGGKTPQKYEKLDYPYVFCPVHMPGFSNYIPSSEREGDQSAEVVERVRYMEGMAGVKRFSEMATEQRKQYSLLRVGDRVVGLYAAVRGFLGLSGRNGESSDASNT